MLVLSRRAPCLPRLPIIEVVSLAASLADPILLVKAHVKPDRAVKSSILIQAEPTQITIKGFRRLFVRKIAILDAPIRDGSGDSMDKLPDRAFASPFARIGTVRNVAVKILRHSYFRRKRAPRLWHLHILLTEDDLAAVIGNLRGPSFPFNNVKRRNLLRAKIVLKLQATVLSSVRFAIAHFQCAGSDACFEFD